MKMKTKLLRCVAAVLTLQFVMSCRTPEPADRAQIRKDLEQAQNDLAKVEKSVEEWGRIAVSDLLLVENTGQFKVTFDEDPTNYVAAARQNVNGAAGSSIASALYLGGAFAGQFTPPVSTGSAPTATNGPLDLTVPNQAQQALSNFSKGLDITGITPVTDERQAVQKGLNDKVAELLLKFMANPVIGTNSQKIVFGVMQVTCQPGKNTRSGYVADVNLHLRYASSLSAGTGDGGTQVNKPSNVEYVWKDKGPQPSVVAVLPLVDNQNVQLENSNRKQTEVALALSAALAAKGVNGAAKMLSDYVNRQQSDINTRTPIPVATSYTDGSTFGFQIYPVFQGVKNPGQTFSRPGEMLHPVTFPAVVAILMDTKDLKPTKTGQTPQLILTGDGSLQLDTVTLSGTSVKGSSGRFSLKALDNVFLKNLDPKNIILPLSGGVVLTNSSSGTFTVPSFATRFTQSDLPNPTALLGRLKKPGAGDLVAQQFLEHFVPRPEPAPLPAPAAAPAPAPAKSLKTAADLLTSLNALIDPPTLQVLPPAFVPKRPESKKRYEGAFVAYTNEALLAVRAANSWKAAAAAASGAAQRHTNSLVANKAEAESARKSLAVARANLDQLNSNKATDAERLEAGEVFRQAVEKYTAATNPVPNATARPATAVSDAVKAAGEAAAKAAEAAAKAAEAAEAVKSAALINDLGVALTNAEIARGLPQAAMASANTAARCAADAGVTNRFADCGAFRKAEADQAILDQFVNELHLEQSILNRLLLEDAFPELKPTAFTSGAGAFKIDPSVAISVLPDQLPIQARGTASFIFQTLSSGSYTPMKAPPEAVVGPKAQRASPAPAAQIQTLISDPGSSGRAASALVALGDADAATTWDLLETGIRTSWVWTGSKPALTSWAKFWRKPFAWWQEPDLTMEERMERAEYIDRAYNAVARVEDGISNLQYQASIQNRIPKRPSRAQDVGGQAARPDNYFYQTEQLRLTLNSLETIALNTTRVDPLPSSLLSTPAVSAGPRISAITPSVLWRDKPTDFWLLLTNLSPLNATESGYLVSVAGQAVTNPETFQTVAGPVLKVTLPRAFGSVTNTTNSLDFVVVGLEGQATKSLAVTLQGKVAAEAGVDITRDATSGKVTGLVLKPGSLDSMEGRPGASLVTEKELLETFRKILEQSERPPGVTNIFR